MGFLRAIVVGLVAIAVAAGVYVFAGFYDVSASRPSGALSAWIFEETMEASVRKRASSIEAPPLQDSALVRTGYEHYRANCEMCHGAPGVEQTELARGLEPAAPELYEHDDEDEEEAEWSPAELFWITKHGIKMTGMPAWGPTHSDKEIWAIVAFLETLPRLTAAEYGALGAPGAAPADRHEHAADDDHGRHAHGHGSVQSNDD